VEDYHVHQGENEGVYKAVQTQEREKEACLTDAEGKREITS